MSRPAGWVSRPWLGAARVFQGEQEGVRITATTATATAIATAATSDTSADAAAASELRIGARWQPVRWIRDLGQAHAARSPGAASDDRGLLGCGDQAAGAELQAADDGVGHPASPAREDAHTVGGRLGRQDEARQGQGRAQVSLENMSLPSDLQQIFDTKTRAWRT